jgi:hypothetical protein
LVKYQVNQPSQTTVELFHLSEDPSEQKNVAAEYPERVIALERLMQTAHRPNPVFRLF